MTTVKPSEFEAIIPPAGATLAESIRLVDMKFPALVFTWFSSVYNPDGSFTDGFARAICDVRASCA